MGYHGWWMLGVVPDGAAAAVRWPGRPAGAAASLAWWREHPGADRERLRVLFESWGHEEGEEEQLDETRWELLRMLEGRPEQERWAFGVRKAFPFHALAFALGPDGVERLPGWAGEFVWDAGQVRERLPEVEAVLGVTGAAREAAFGRAAEWLAGVGDGDGQVAELFEEPLRVLRAAARAGEGAMGVEMVF
ncbi:hypothetical protein HUT16_07215 [Kitasatospora sp. NA04385]|uniref:hypothetical protein n=1 Tax=Kitasatospora sp. NA04385 TaxID=2742135 RepID=UPI0015922929|nr:hypothetical protein [Kitasatospora sp. NA04385]QKW18886.1 hypothetical protein HUT16_07215 [Kitasatospora sp. NA04385]